MSIALCLISAVASALRGGYYAHPEAPEAISPADTAPLTPVTTPVAAATGPVLQGPVPPSRAPITTATGPSAAGWGPPSAADDGAPPPAPGGRGLQGVVYTAGHRPAAAVLSLLDQRGGLVDHTGTDAHGAYRLAAPAAGQYLLVCAPARHTGAPDEPAAPRAAHWVSLNGRPIEHDIHGSTPSARPPDSPPDQPGLAPTVPR